MLKIVNCPCCLAELPAALAKDVANPKREESCPEKNDQSVGEILAEYDALLALSEEESALVEDLWNNYLDATHKMYFEFND